MTLGVEISNFKTLEYLKIELSPLTILVGPPASGKSNILDALALAGYFGRAKRVGEEYDGIGALEPLKRIARFEEPSDLFRYYDITKPISIAITGEVEQILEAGYSQGIFTVKINNSPVNIPLASLPPMEKLKIEARLYGYDRYGLGLPYCDQHACGFYAMLKGQVRSPYPKSILSETGQNAANIVGKAINVIREINNELSKLGEKIEVKVLSTGGVVVFDYDVEIKPGAVSDGILRIIYYTTALETATRYAVQYGEKMVVLLEEPDAHVYPYLLDLLASGVEKAVRNGLYTVLTTHNPLALSRLWELAQAKTYYVWRGPTGATHATEIDMDKLARDLATADEILLSPPREFVKKYGK